MASVRWYNGIIHLAAHLGYRGRVTKVRHHFGNLFVSAVWPSELSRCIPIVTTTRQTTFGARRSSRRFIHPPHFVPIQHQLVAARHRTETLCAADPASPLRSIFSCGGGAEIGTRQPMPVSGRPSMSWMDVQMAVESCPNHEPPVWQYPARDRGSKIACTCSLFPIALAANPE